MDNLNNAVFSSLKPVCDRLIINVCEQTINDLKLLLPTLPSKAIQRFQSYISFPIEVNLLKTSNSQHKQMLVETLTQLFNHSRIDSATTLFRLCTLLLQQVITKDKIADVSEELKLSVVRCINRLWLSSMSEVLYNVYSRASYPQLSPVVFMLVQLARNEKLIQLRVEALETLLVLCHVNDSVDNADVEMMQRAQNVVMLMLPGIVTCCNSIAAEPNTQNHKITVANIRLWGSVVGLVMADGEMTAEVVEGEETPPSGGTQVERVQQLQRQLRTEAWLRDTAERLTVVTEVLLRYQTHTHWQVRLQLTKAVTHLLARCSQNMAGSTGCFVCCLIVLSEDDMAEVYGPARQSLAELSSKLQDDTGQPLLQQVQSAFFNLLTRAPRIMQGTDEGSQLTCMSLLVGYLRLQDSRLPHVLSSGPFLYRLLVTLVHVSHLETSHVSLLEECAIRG
ncbi:TEL2-interacting protein 1 [Homalodisca vitripennis]|nr:TEL2-interacting protein 1 [Homalodisca vitripennis]